MACDVLQQLLPLADSFDSAFQQLKPAHGGAAAAENERLIHAAYEALHKQLLEIFRWDGTPQARCCCGATSPGVPGGVQDARCARDLSHKQAAPCPSPLPRIAGPTTSSG